MAFRSVISSKIPLVIVLGATGTGKTKLGVELAQKFKTEVISADSMQIYKGLDVVTAKASPRERELVPHHLLDILEPTQMFTVVDFRSRALKIIDDLTQQGKIPIMVGGTNYYVEAIVYKILVEDMNDTNSLLWDNSVVKRGSDEIHDTESKRKIPNIEGNITSEANKSKEDEEATTSKSNKEVKDKEDVVHICKEKLEEDLNNEERFSNEELHAKLKEIDPVMAARLHPNNRRKVIRSMEVWLKSGRRHSELLAEQKQSEGELRRPGSTVIFWLKCDQAVHEERLDKRVDAMLEAGLIDELLDFHDRHNKQRIKDGKPPDYTKGIFQTLGFKEFHSYLMMSPEERSSDAGKALLQQSIEEMKMATRRYARRQNKMVRGRFLEHPARQVPPIYELDTTDISKWDEEVKNKAIEIVESYYNGLPCKFEPLKSTMDDEKRKMDGNSYNFCETCERIFIGDNVYALHLKSYRHMKVLKKKKRLEEAAIKKTRKGEGRGTE